MLSKKRYGYELDEEKKWKIVPCEAEVVRKMYRDVIAGKNTRQIARELYDAGIKSIKGEKSWANCTIDSIIRNPFNCGQLVMQKSYVKDTLEGKTYPNNGELPKYIIDNNHPAIVTPEIWEAAQVIMENRGKNRGDKKGTVRNMHDRKEFFKIFRCAECGSMVTHVKSAHTKDHYWRCRESEAKKAGYICHARSFREVSIEHTFMAMLHEMKNYKVLKKKVDRAITENRLSDKEHSLVNNLKENLNCRYQRLYLLVEESKLHGEDTETVKMSTRAIIKLQAQINELNQKQEKADAMLAELKWLQKELEKLEDFNPEKERIPFRADIFSRIVENGVIHPDGKIDYNLKLGITWTAKGNEKRVWKLPMKSK